MLAFSNISQKTVLGKLLRLPLRLLPPEMPVIILQGKLKGKKWIAGSYKHSCWLGCYEFYNQRFVTSVVKPGTVFFDLGANVGFYTLLASVLVGEKGQVFAFEPLPRNLNYLERHLRFNNVKNVTVIKAAVSDHSGKTIFYDMGEEGGGGQISSAFNSKDNANNTGNQTPCKATLPIDLVQLDSLVLEGKLPEPDYMKIDVEGAEADVLMGSQTILKTKHPIIFLSTHNSEVHHRCLRILDNLGYKCEPLFDKDLDTCKELVAAYNKPGNPSIENGMLAESAPSVSSIV
jgi:FkbM family methyltransferase